MEGKGLFMDRKKFLAVVLLPFLLVFCSAWAMDKPQNLEDAGVHVIGFVNNYLKIPSDDVKRHYSDLLYKYLNALKVQDPSNLFLATSIDDTQWINIFKEWDLSQGDQKMREFKEHIYKSYFELEGRKPICQLLKSTANKLRSDTHEKKALPELEKFDDEDILKPLELLSKALPYRKNRIDILIQYLREYPVDRLDLSEALKKICKKEKSRGEQADYIARYNTNLSAKNKLEAVEKIAKKKEPRGELLQLLWLEDEDEFGKIKERIEKEQQLADYYSSTHLGKIEHELKDKANKSIDVEQLSVEDIKSHLVGLVKDIDRIIALEQTDSGWKRLLILYEKKLNDDANKVIKSSIKHRIVDKEVQEYFQHPKLHQYFDQFLLKKYEETPFTASGSDDYFKNYDVVLSKLRMAGKIVEVEKYEKILYARAIIAIAKSITSEPKEQQKNQFSATENLKNYWKMQEQANRVSSVMYDYVSREDNIDLLSDIIVRIEKLLGEGEVPTAATLRVYVILDRLKFFKDFLELQKNMEIWQKNFDEEGIIYKDVADKLIVALSKISDYVEKANSKDIEQIQKLQDYSVFIYFINNTFNQLTDQNQAKVTQACQKIQNKVPERKFPVPGKQEQFVPSISEEERTREAQKTLDLAKQRRERAIADAIARQEQQHQRPEAEIVARQHPGRIRPERQQFVVVPRQPAGRPADNEPQGFMEIVSMLFEGLRNMISTWVRRIFFGG